MTPDQLAKSGTEHGEQVALFAFLAVAHNQGFETAWEWADKGDAVLLGRSIISATRAVPALEWLHAIPNGGSRGDDEKSRAIRGGALKAEGVRQGVADIFLPWPIYELKNHEYSYLFGDEEVFDVVNSSEIKWCGLYIEMKKPSLKPKSAEAKGGLSDEQIEFASYAKRNGYGWIVCYTWREAAKAIQQYIEWGTK